MEIAKRLNGIGEYYFSQKLREIEALNGQGKNVINLGVGSPDLPPHPEVINVLHRESIKSNAHAYQSYKGSLLLRNAMSDWYKKWYSVDLDPTKEILPLIGSKEGIMHICMTYLDQGSKALVPNPGYPTYRSAVMLAGGECMDYFLDEENGYSPDFAAIEASDLSAVKLMWVNYPHMPTGKAPDKKLFENLIAFGKKHDILVCHDNPYSFILNEKPLSLLGIEGAKDTAVELNSLSKSHNMAGWRIGMLAGAPNRIDEVLRFKSNMDSGMFLPVQLAAAKALELEASWFEKLNDTYAARREKAFELMDLLNCSYSPDQVGMFAWAKINPEYTDAFTLSDKILRQASVFITPGGIFGSAGNNFLRASLCSPTEVYDEAIQRIKKIINAI